MLVDFCHHSAGSAINTDKVSFDGYEIGNLIASNPQLRSQGFLSDHFVKPPVNISIQFPCNVSLYRIVIDPAIGRQQSNDIKIFTASKKVENSWLYGGNNKTVQTSGLFFNQVSFIKQSNPSIICLQSHVFKPSRMWSIDNSQSYGQYTETGELRSSKQGALSNVSHVNICVLRTRSGSSAAIRRLEIWGMPSHTVPKHVQEKLMKCYVDAVYPSPKQPKQNTNIRTVTCVKDNDSDSKIESRGSSNCNNIEEDEFSVPDDFKDQITFEIMACPILLPSGKNVDQSTLDKFVNTEASWGRPPSDPFTGLAFTHGRQPMSNIALKSRIDDFTFKHADRLSVPKTLGRLNKEMKTMTSSRLTATETVSYQHSRTLCKDKEGESVQHTLKEVKDRNFDRKRKSLYNSTDQRLKFSRQMGTIQRNSDIKVCDTPKQPCPQLYTMQASKTNKSVSNQFNLSKVSVHTDNLSYSLDNALESALGSLPRFTVKSNFNDTKIQSQNKFAKFSKSDSTDKNESMCNKCGIDCKMTDVIKYRIACGHLVCRTCLNESTLSKDDMTCSLCKVKFNTDELVRVF